ncbi:MAG: YdcH family protein [Alphaproteobacteria bacterium]|nr:DUF465 domain-containing protein [Alphaproteobacteria bacterium]MDE2337293.1 YdcH family protein [Alphaproteobacteria bacterium]
MQASHLKSLKDKHDRLERKIRDERVRPSHDDVLIERLKKEKLQVKELIARMENAPPEEARAGT